VGLAAEKDEVTGSAHTMNEPNIAPSYALPRPQGLIRRYCKL
jgi:hypothetical protein